MKLCDDDQNIGNFVVGKVFKIYLFLFLSLSFCCKVAHVVSVISTRVYIVGASSDASIVREFVVGF